MSKDGYFVAWARDIGGLNEEVNRQMDRGYVPIGGMSNYADTGPKGGYVFCQAMVLAEKATNES